MGSLHAPPPSSATNAASAVVASAGSASAGASNNSNNSPSSALQNLPESAAATDFADHLVSTWPEWNDTEILAEKWNAKFTFEDVDACIQYMPRSLAHLVDSLRRPAEVTYHINTTTANTHTPINVVANSNSSDINKNTNNAILSSGENSGNANTNTNSNNSGHTTNGPHSGSGNAASHNVSVSSDNNNNNNYNNSSTSSSDSDATGSTGTNSNATNVTPTNATISGVANAPVLAINTSLHVGPAQITLPQGGSHMPHQKVASVPGLESGSPPAQQNIASNNSQLASQMASVSNNAFVATNADLGPAQGVLSSVSNNTSAQSSTVQPAAGPAPIPPNTPVTLPATPTALPISSHSFTGSFTVVATGSAYDSPILNDSAAVAANARIFAHSEFMKELLRRLQSLIALRTTAPSDETVSVPASVPWPWDLIFPKARDGVTPTLNPTGRYAVRLFWCGAWRRVNVDDRVPVDADGCPLLLISPAVCEIWPLLICKAILKLWHSSFDDRPECPEFGDFFIPHTLLGWPVEHLSVESPTQCLLRVIGIASACGPQFISNHLIANTSAGGLSTVAEVPSVAMVFGANLNNTNNTTNSSFSQVTHAPSSGNSVVAGDAISSNAAINVGSVNSSTSIPTDVNASSTFHTSHGSSINNIGGVSSSRAGSPSSNFVQNAQKQPAINMLMFFTFDGNSKILRLVDMYGTAQSINDFRFRLHVISCSAAAPISNSYNFIPISQDAQSIISHASTGSVVIVRARDFLCNCKAVHAMFSPTHFRPLKVFSTTYLNPQSDRLANEGQLPRVPPLAFLPAESPPSLVVATYFAHSRLSPRRTKPPTLFIESYDQTTLPPPGTSTRVARIVTHSTSSKLLLLSPGDCIRFLPDAPGNHCVQLYCREEQHVVVEDEAKLLTDRFGYSVRDVDENYPAYPPSSWAVLMKHTFTVRQPIFAAFHLILPEPAQETVTLTFTDNDEPASNILVPALAIGVQQLVPNSGGYTVTASTALSTARPAGRLRLRLISKPGPIHMPEKLSIDLGTKLATHDFEEFYVPNKGNVLFRNVIRLPTISECQLAFLLSYAGPHDILTFELFENSFHLFKHEGAKVVAVPNVALRRTEDALPSNPVPERERTNSKAQNAETQHQHHQQQTQHQHQLNSASSSSIVSNSSQQRKATPTSQGGSASSSGSQSGPRYILQASFTEGLNRAQVAATDALSLAVQTPLQIPQQNQQQAASQALASPTTPQTADGATPPRKMNLAGAGSTHASSTGAFGQPAQTGLTGNNQTALQGQPKAVCATEYKWSLRVWCSEAQGVSIVKDTEREERHRKIKEKWESKQPGRAAQAREIREAYLATCVAAASAAHALSANGSKPASAAPQVSQVNSSATPVQVSCETPTSPEIVAESAEARAGSMLASAPKLLTQADQDAMSAQIEQTTELFRSQCEAVHGQWALEKRAAEETKVAVQKGIKTARSLVSAFRNVDSSARASKRITIAAALAASLIPSNSHSSSLPASSAISSSATSLGSPEHNPDGDATATVCAPLGTPVPSNTSGGQGSGGKTGANVTAASPQPTQPATIHQDSTSIPSNAEAPLRKKKRA